MRKVGHIKKAYASNTSDAKSAYALVESREAVRAVTRAAHNTKADESHILTVDGVGAAARLNNFSRKTSVFLGNLPANTIEAEIRAAMRPAGEVHAVRVVRDKKTQACKGFAFVRFEERSSVKAALELWGVEVQGREIRVMRVEEPEGEPKKRAAGDEEEELHPAAWRIMHRSEKRQRHKLHRAKETAAAQKAAGLGPKRKKDAKAGKTKRTSKKLTGKDHKIKKAQKKADKGKVNKKKA